jgi:hypothetical protein
MTVDVSCRRILFRLAAIGGSLMAIAAMLPLLAHVAGIDPDAANFRQFDLRSVGNFPVLFTTVLFAFAIALIVPVARLEPRRADRIAWRWLAALFGYLALDETARLRDSFDHLHFAAAGRLLPGVHPWIWIYSIAAVAIAAVYARFLLRQPRPLTAGLLAAGALYVIGLPGAAVVEPFLGGTGMLGHGIGALLFGLFGQALRMAGALTLVGTLLHRLRTAEITVTVDVGFPRAAAVEPPAVPGLVPVSPGESRDAA